MFSDIIGFVLILISLSKNTKYINEIKCKLYNYLVKTKYTSLFNSKHTLIRYVDTASFIFNSGTT